MDKIVKVTTIDEEFGKSKVKAHIRTKKGRLEQVREHERKGSGTTSQKFMKNRYKIASEAKTLNELKQNVPIIGNAYHDMPIFQAADRLFLSSKSIIERKRILDFVGQEVMGMKHKHTNQDVKEHVKFLEEG